MKALVLNGYGGNEKLSLVEAPKPVPTAKQVLIRVEYAGLNPVDYKTRQGELRAISKLKFPHVMGNEIGGVVEGVGDAVTKFKPGDKVFSRLNKFNMGAFAEFVAEDESLVALAPKNTSLEVSAGVPLVGLTAWQCLYDIGKIKKGDEVLIHGGAGSVGRLAIQFAKRAGARVTATGSGPSKDLVLGLGADEFIDYRTQKFEDAGKKFDIAYDLVGGETLNRSFSVVKKGGIVISIAGMPEPTTARELGKGFALQALFRIISAKQLKLAKKAGATYRFMLMNPDGDKLAEFARWIEAGELKVTIDRVFPVEQFKEAFEYQESGRAKGKVILKIR